LSIGDKVIEASEATVKSGAYPIQRVLWVFTKGKPSAVEQAFIDFLLGAEGQKIVAEMGYMPIK
jgi:phosphate transport system substrate-binding protein